MPARAAITQPVRKSPPLIMTGMNGLSSHLRQRMQMRKTRICKRDSFRKKTKSIPRLGHTHNMIYCAAVAATYNAEGNVECWSCSKCGKNFGDSAGTNPLTTVQAAINSANHKTNTTWTQTSGKHYRICENDCDTHLDKAPCSVCSGGYGTLADHDFASEWSKDENSHWHRC